MTDNILIIDFGSQVTQLIARRVRESGVYCEIVPFNNAEGMLESFKPKAVILSGSPASVIGPDAPRAPDWVFTAGLPVLGICYGQQTMCAQLGGRVEGSDDEREFGRSAIKVVENSPLFDGIMNVGDQEPVWMSHGDRVVELPSGFKVIGISGNAPFAAIADEARHFYGVQFHPEVAHTPRGRDILRNFTHKIAGCKGDWTMAAFKDVESARIRKSVGWVGLEAAGDEGVGLGQVQRDPRRLVDGVTLRRAGDRLVEAQFELYPIPRQRSDIHTLQISRKGQRTQQ